MEGNLANRDIGGTQQNKLARKTTWDVKGTNKYKNESRWKNLWKNAEELRIASNAWLETKKIHQRNSVKKSHLRIVERSGENVHVDGKKSEKKMT